jgi:TonB family protein
VSATAPHAGDVGTAEPSSVAPAASAPATPDTPLAPFFEMKDVNESPRVETRVEPKVPDALKGRSSNEVVVVRALVSQSGHPSRVSLLRGAKAGPELDTVVVEAVNQWTFTPAMKKGKAVSCWFNFGVQVRPAE